jgi:pyrimidine oxygenase
VGSYVLFMVIADETDEAARAKWEHYKAGADDEALAWLTEQSQKDTRSGSDTNVRQMADPTSAVNINMGTLVGSYASVARMLDEVASVPGTDGVLLTFDDFLAGIDAFGERIQPLMRCRDHIAPLPVRWPDDYPSRSPGIPDLRAAAERADRGRYAERLRQPGRLSGSRRL